MSLPSTTNEPPMYAILGANGKVGFATILALRKAGASVRAIVRSETNISKLSALGCEIARADLQDVDALTKAIGDAAAVQLILPPSPAAEDPAANMRQSIECIANALERVRPNRLLAISDYGAHIATDIGMPSIFRHFEQRLSQLRGHKIFLRSAEHMENWARVIPVAVASGALPSFYDPVDARYATIAARDLGLIAAELLLRPIQDEGIRSEGGTIVHAEGPHRYSVSDVAACMSEILGKTVRVDVVPRAQWNKVLGNSSLAELLIKFNDARNKSGLVEIEPGSTEIRYGTTELKVVIQGLLASQA